MYSNLEYAAKKDVELKGKESDKSLYLQAMGDSYGFGKPVEQKKFDPKLDKMLPGLEITDMKGGKKPVDEGFDKNGYNKCWVKPGEKGDEKDLSFNKLDGKKGELDKCGGEAPVHKLTKEEMAIMIQIKELEAKLAKLEAANHPTFKGGDVEKPGDKPHHKLGYIPADKPEHKFHGKPVNNIDKSQAEYTIWK